MKKKTFVRPEAQLTAFECQNILAGSGNEETNQNDPNGTNQFSTEPLTPGNFDWNNGNLGG